MPTELRKPKNSKRTGEVSRRCVEAYDHRGKRLVVTLVPGDVISFREEGCRTEFTAELSRVFRQVVRWHVDADKSKKMAEKGIKPRRTLAKRGKLR